MEIVIFSKSLTKTDIKERLTVPTDALEHINMPEAKELQIGDEVTFSKLEDEVTFSKLEDEDEAGGAPQYRIHATRAITLWGEEIVVDLPHP
ncbi:hypothetical protein Q3G72_008000 [Acer saccharum]|nr:hypothetical protein Q3G72_008000 [Acer saccharum]